MTTEDIEGYLALCQQAARIAAGGKDIDPEDVSQELFAWILSTRAITAPTYRGLLGLLIREARSYIAAQRRQSHPYGWSGETWTADDIRTLLRESYHDLPPLLAEALASPRMPQSYRRVLDATYGNGVSPARGTALRRQMYRAADRLHEIVTHPTEGVGTAVDIASLWDADDQPRDGQSEQCREARSRNALLARLDRLRAA